MLYNENCTDFLYPQSSIFYIKLIPHFWSTKVIIGINHGFFPGFEGDFSHGDTTTITHFSSMNIFYTVT
jgi:hypothetical protein